MKASELPPRVPGCLVSHEERWAGGAPCLGFSTRAHKANDRCDDRY
jgi:hypothetical protein